MGKTKNIIFNISFLLNCLLVFLVMVENKISIPAWLQVAGRMHPLILHLPITLLILCITWFLFAERRMENESAKQIGDWLLLLTSVTTVVTALVGLFLSRENGYEADKILWHKWSGILTSIITALWYAYRNKLRQSKALNIGIAIVGFILILVTGHQGANITHGENFLLAPITPEKTAPKVLLEDAYVFNDMVKPIIQSKCISCHNSQKAKGNLIMETEALLLKGGKNGKLWDLNEAEFGLMLHRLHLPEEAKKHMPPKGKPQLSKEELQVIYYWVKGGADFKKKVMDLPEQDTLRMLAASIFNTIETDDYSFAAADEKTIKSLNNNYRVVYPLAKESPALGVDFYGAQFYQPKQLEELLKVKEQVVTINLNKMPVKDEALKTISQFANLRKLNLSFSAITGKTINELLKLKELKHLSLSGTAVKFNDVSPLSSLKKLTHLDLWNTNVKDDEIKTLLATNKSLIIETGYKGDTDRIKLTAPLLENETVVIDTPIHLQLKHNVPGVNVRYTLDGTDPDSLHSPVYDKNIVLTKNVLVKTKAFKPGWISSDILETYFYAAKIKCDTVINILPADSAFRGNGSRTLIDLVKGETTNFGSGKWVGYHGKKMESVIGFNTAQTVSSVTLSTLIDTYSYIMPPVSIEIWGEDENGKYRKLNSLIPAQPAALQAAYLKGYEIDFAPATVKSIKIIAVPVTKLPAWHPGKGDKGWIFVDEVFIN
ncbi:MAG: hypothetical protein EKK37_15475 [Sphingobacteriales bacterium]|nr:MAG: hypothetical protein EKK37_15475 [Sphingobacteriales bacterium]